MVSGSADAEERRSVRTARGADHEDVSDDDESRQKTGNGIFYETPVPAMGKKNQPSKYISDEPLYGKHEKKRRTRKKQRKGAMTTMKNYPWWLEGTFEDGVPDWAQDTNEENKEVKADENVND